MGTEKLRRSVYIWYNKKNWLRMENIRLAFPFISTDAISFVYRLQNFTYSNNTRKIIMSEWIGQNICELVNFQAN